MSHGWIKDKFFRVAPLGITVNAEAADVITVDLALVDQAGDAIAEARDFLAEVLDVNAELALVGAFTLDETGAGAEVTASTRPALIITTSAGGLAQLSVTDVAGASGLTVYVKITPMDLRGAPTLTAITFD